MEEKTYRLKKDTPFEKAGLIYKQQGEYVTTEDGRSAYLIKSVEDFDVWFEELPSEDEKECLHGYSKWTYTKLFVINRCTLCHQTLQMYSADPEESLYSLQDLYRFVTDYSKEANEEGFDVSVGDFVDWVASREEPCDCKTNANADGTVEMIFCEKHFQLGWIAGKEAKPVLPEKLEDPYYVQYSTESERDMLLLIVKLIKKQNEVIDYLKDKNI